MNIALSTVLFLYSFLALGSYYIDYAWDIYLIGFVMTSFLTSVGWYNQIEHKMVKLRCMVLGLCFYFLSFIIMYPLTFFSNSAIIEIIRSSGLLVWLLFICFRAEKTKSCRLNSKDLFVIRIKPKTFQDTIISMFGCGLGGYGIYYNEKFYHYRKGVFVIDSSKLLRKNKSNYVILKYGKVEENIIKCLDGMVGSKWSIRNNCITNIARMVNK